MNAERRNEIAWLLDKTDYTAGGTHSIRNPVNYDISKAATQIAESLSTLADIRRKLMQWGGLSEAETPTMEELRLYATELSKET